jgi:hypothetical protein
VNNPKKPQGYNSISRFGLIVLGIGGPWLFSTEVLGAMAALFSISKQRTPVAQVSVAKIRIASSAPDLSVFGPAAKPETLTILQCASVCCTNVAHAAYATQMFVCHFPQDTSSPKQTSPSASFSDHDQVDGSCPGACARYSAPCELIMTGQCYRIPSAVLIPELSLELQRSFKIEAKYVVGSFQKEWHLSDRRVGHGLMVNWNRINTVHRHPPYTFSASATVKARDNPFPITGALHHP